MKSLSLWLILPLSLLSNFLVTKWWYVLPVDGVDQLNYGFPFLNEAPGGSSMSRKIFVLETAGNIIFYFLVWFIIVFLIHRFLNKISIYRTIRIISLLVMSVLSFQLIISFFLLETSFLLKRNYEIEVMDSGYKYVWQEIPYPDYYKYHPEKKTIMSLIQLQQIKLQEPEKNIFFFNPDCQRILIKQFEFFKKKGYIVPWTGYFAIHDHIAVGSCGFKGSPNDKKVEIAYETFKQFEGKGYGTTMCKLLIDIAFKADPSISITAETRESNHASNSILQKNNFEIINILPPENGENILEWQYMVKVEA